MAAGEDAGEDAGEESEEEHDEEVVPDKACIPQQQRKRQRPDSAHSTDQTSAVTAQLDEVSVGSLVEVIQYKNGEAESAESSCVARIEQQNADGRFSVKYHHDSTSEARKENDLRPIPPNTPANFLAKLSVGDQADLSYNTHYWKHVWVRKVSDGKTLEVR